MGHDQLEKMCLILTVTAPAKDRDRFTEACREAGLLHDSAADRPGFAAVANDRTVDAGFEF